MPKSGSYMNKEIARKIIHVDMDAFYASVEQRDNPQLRGKPVIVGGKPHGRGVVAACSYEARQFGVHSAMPSAEAGRRCPEAVFVKPRFEDYKAASIQIHEVFQQYTGLIEPLSLDEAYLDVSHNSRFKGSAVLLANDIKQSVFRHTQLVASAGVSYNKFLAKIASDFDKPDGLYCITPEQGEQFVAQLPIGRFHGIGKVTEARMHELGIRTGADLRRWSLAELEREFGKSALYYYKASRAVDEREVSVSRKRRSMGSERTFSHNLVEKSAMLDVLFALGDELLASLAERQLAAATVSVKVRFGDFETLTRAYTHASGSISKACFDRVVPYLLDRALHARDDHAVGRRPCKPGVRLLGVSFSTLIGVADSVPQQLEMDV